MPLHRRDKFLNEVLSYIKFPFDRDDIRMELECHISDKIEFYIDQGYDMETAEELSINEMGDIKEIGLGLNKEHNPLLGWLWKISNVAVILFAIWNIYFIGSFLLLTLFQDNPIKSIQKPNILYSIDVNKKVQLDDTIINFTKVVYEKNGTINIAYEYYNTKFWESGWSFGGIGTITDNFGNEYFGGSIENGGNFKSKGMSKITNFSSEADTLIISYDYYNRRYKVEIPLREGDYHE